MSGNIAPPHVWVKGMNPLHSPLGVLFETFTVQYPFFVRLGGMSLLEIQSDLTSPPPQGEVVETSSFAVPFTGGVLLEILGHSHSKRRAMGSSKERPWPWTK